jgi:hypothetical protein
MGDYKITRRDPSKVYPKLPEILVGDNEETLVIYGDIDMTDCSELAKRLRSSELWARHERDGFRTDGLPFEAADALEAQAKEIAEKDTRISELAAALNSSRDKAFEDAALEIERTGPATYPNKLIADGYAISVRKLKARAALKGEK